MKVKLRLYRQHDLDLIGLFINPEFNFAKEAKKALAAYVRGKPYVVSSPDPVLPKKKVSYLIQTNIILDESETDVIQWLLSMKSGYRNSLVKNILRGYMSAPNVFLYSEDVDIKTPESVAEVPGKPTVRFSPAPKAPRKAFDGPKPEAGKENVYVMPPPPSVKNDYGKNHNDINAPSGNENGEVSDLIDMVEDMMDTLF